MIRFMLALSTAASLAASAALAAAPPTPAPPALQFVTQAGQGDVYEQIAGQLAIMYGSNAAVKDFGAMLVVDHGKTSADLAAAAAASGLTPTSPGLSPAQSDMLNALRNAPAAQFDGLFLSQQQQAHTQALAMLGGYASGGDNAALRAAAQRAVPIVQGHLDRVQALAAQVR
ncbi:MAG: hypothetical protein JWM33_808 [Caulobacteraceae bacterium]|nr:hypothetical protein [Caulobacteraceae bacterium]